MWKKMRDEGSVPRACMSNAINQERSTLTNHVDRFLAEGVEGSDRLGVGLVSALGDNQVRKFGGDINIGRFKSVALNRGPTARSRDANARLSRCQRDRVVAAAQV